MQWQEFRTHVRHLPAKDLARVEHAFLLGKKMHGDQKRRSGEPYFMHPVAVAQMLTGLGADPDTIIAALLHDTVEDTPLTLDEIDAQFGGSVASLIDGVTKLSSKDVAMSPKLDEQIETLRKIFTLMQQDIRIMVIKLVDRLHNMQTVEFLPLDRQKLLARETLEVFVKIADRLCMQDIRDDLEALCLSVLEPSLYAQLSELSLANEQSGNAVVDAMHDRLRSHDRLLFSKTTLHFEPKAWHQLKAQSVAGATVVTGMSTATAVFTCQDVDTCYRILGALHQIWKREILSFQDFINAPQLNGYRGLHTTVIAQDGTRVRCKIRTKEMQEYARKGVTTVCFKAMSRIAEILPWTERLTSLTTDTEGSSNDFWNSLKSDILGESITIHGPDDSTVQLSGDATALDGAFHLIQDRALRITSIRINGQGVPFSASLINAASLDFTLSENETTSREWLSQVHTGFAAAKIRSALLKQSEEHKLPIGRNMLQQVFTSRKRGFIEEFDERTVQNHLETLGYHSLKEVYIGIADGRLEPTDVYSAIFDKPKRRTHEKIPSSIVRYSVDMESVDVMDRINLIHRKHGAALADIRYHRTHGGRAQVSLHVFMQPHELMSFQRDLEQAGATHLSVIRQSRATFLLIGIIILLWGLDPVMARILLLSGDITALHLTVVRFVTFFCAASVTYALHIAASQVKAKSIRPFQFSLIASAIALFCTAILSYFALQYVPATQYIIFIVAGLTLTSCIEQVLEGTVGRRMVFASITIAAVAGFLVYVQGYSQIGVLAGIGSSLGFSMYSQISRRYQETEARIHARYPAFVFWLSAITLILSLFILPSVNTLAIVDLHMELLAILFAFVFTFLPYVLYFECMQRTNIDNLNRLLPFVCLATIAGETAFNGSNAALWALPLIAVFLWVIKPSWYASRQ